MGSKSKSTSRTVYGNTTTSNPYAYSNTTNKGTIAGFNNGTALNSVYNFVNKSIDSLLEEYMKPTLSSKTNQAKLNSFANTLNSQTINNLENGIINPLSERNMLRSSQANDLYKNLINQNVQQTSNYANELLSNSQEQTAKMLANLLMYYMQGANYLSDMQSHSLNASSGNATKYNTTTTGNAAADIIPAALSVLSATL